MLLRPGLPRKKDSHDLARCGMAPNPQSAAPVVPVSYPRPLSVFAGERGGAPHGAGVLAAPDLCGPAPLGLGPAPHRWRDRPPARDRLAHIAERGSRGSSFAARGSATLRVALPRRPPCTSTASASPASAIPGMRSPAFVIAPGPRSACVSATSSCTPSSTTTRAWPRRSESVSLALRLRSGGLPSPYDPGENDEEEDGESDPEHDSRRVAAHNLFLTRLHDGHATGILSPGPVFEPQRGLPRGKKSTGISHVQEGRALQPRLG